MRIKGAMTVLKKEMEFLGLTFEQLCVMIKHNPYAMPNKVIEAYGVYLKEENKNVESARR